MHGSRSGLVWKTPCLLLLLLIPSLASGGPGRRYTKEELAKMRAASAQESAEMAAVGVAACARAEEVAKARRPSAASMGGSQPRSAACFFGTVKTERNPFLGTDVQVYDDGAYVPPPVPGREPEAYVGRFVYLSGWREYQNGTYVLVGLRIRGESDELLGIFVAEGVIPGAGFLLARAEQDYLDRIEQNHAFQVRQFTEEQRRKAQSQRPGFNFGQALALGLGAVLIGAAGSIGDIPPDKLVELGTSYAADVMTDGEAGMLQGLMRREMENLQASAEEPQERDLGNYDWPVECGSGTKGNLSIPRGPCEQQYKDYGRAASCNDARNMEPARQALAACEDGATNAKAKLRKGDNATFVP